jgi:transposase
MDAVRYRYRAGLPWADPPERFGGATSIGQRFRRWAASGVWRRVSATLGADADHEYAALGRGRGGLSTEIRAAVNALGNPVARHLTGGQAHDLEGADALLAAIAAAARVPASRQSGTARTRATLTATATGPATSSSASSASAGSAGGSPPATTRPAAASSPASTSPRQRSCTTAATT